MADIKFQYGDMKALADPDTHVSHFEVTPELFEKIERVGNSIYQTLKRETATPAEGYAILVHLMTFFQDEYGMRGMMVTEENKSKGSS